MTDETRKIVKFELAKIDTGTFVAELVIHDEIKHFTDADPAKALIKAIEYATSVVGGSPQEAALKLHDALMDIDGESQ